MCMCCVRGNRCRLPRNKACVCLLHVFMVTDTVYREIMYVHVSFMFSVVTDIVYHEIIYVYASSLFLVVADIVYHEIFYAYVSFMCFRGNGYRLPRNNACACFLYLFRGNRYRLPRNNLCSGFLPLFMVTDIVHEMIYVYVSFIFCMVTDIVYRDFFLCICPLSFSW